MLVILLIASVFKAIVENVDAMAVSHTIFPITNVSGSISKRPCAMTAIITISAFNLDCVPFS